MTEKTAEEVFNDEKDPLSAISELRAEGVTSPYEGAEDSDGEVPGDNDNLGELSDEDSADDLSTDSDDDSNSDSNNDLDDSASSETEQDTVTENSADDGEADTDNNTSTELAKRKFKAVGQDFEFTDEEILEKFETVFGQAMDYTQKMQKMSPYRKMISAIEQEGVTHDQLNLAIDALKGNKDAVAELIKINEIDQYDLDTGSENPYVPTNYGKDDQQQEFDDIIKSISQDAEYGQTAKVVNTVWDADSQDALSQNPNMIVGLHNDIKTGVYDKVAPEAMKMKMLDGSRKSDIEYYLLAGQELSTQQAENQDTVEKLNQKTQAAENQYDQASSEASRRRSAASTRTRADRKGVVDYLDDDDEKFNDWYDNLMSKN